MRIAPKIAAEHPQVPELIVPYLHDAVEFHLRSFTEEDTNWKVIAAQYGLKHITLHAPFGVHMDDGKVDQVSLSHAGCMYLDAQGLPAEALFGEEMNQKYKGERGVYNSSDECYVARRIFEDMGFGQLHCVCSSAQLMRKALSYIQFGCIPFMHSVSCERMYHNYVDEVFRYIPILLEDGNGLQKDSDEADRLRRMRNPNLIYNSAEK